MSQPPQPLAMASSPPRRPPVRQTTMQQHTEVYLEMICNISNIPITELVVDPDGSGAGGGGGNYADDDGDGADYGAMSPGSFGANVHGDDLHDQHEQEAHENTTQEKSASLLHTECIVFDLLQHRCTEVPPDTPDNSFGMLIFHTLRPNFEKLSDVLDVLGSAPVHLFFHQVIYHIATVVAFQHYFRLVVLRTGQFAPQRTMNVQQSYQRTLLAGLFHTILSIEQVQYMHEYGYSRA